MPSVLELSTERARLSAMSNRPDGVSETEWRTRIDLAACYRLMALYRMTDLANGFIGARIPDEPDHFLLNRYGDFHEEVTASSLHKLPIHEWPAAEGGTEKKVAEGGTEKKVAEGGTEKKVAERGTDMNAAAVSMCQAVLAARDDVQCVLHAHTRASMIFASLQTELLPISQSAVMMRGLWAFSEFEFECGEEFCRQLLADLGGKSALLMRNHGLFAAGRSVPEVFFLAFFLNQACDVQLGCMSSGADIHEPAAAKTEAWHAGYHDNPWWEYDGSREWPALLRKLERELPGFAA